MTTNAPLPMQVAQVALVVNDIDAVRQTWARAFGLTEPPPVQVTGEPAEAHGCYQGRPTTARAKLCFFRCGPMQIELIEPIGDGDSVWHEHLRTHGEGVQHIAFQVPDMDATVSTLGEQGLPMNQRGDFPGGRYAYIDGTDALKVTVELLTSGSQWGPVEPPA